MLGRQSSSCCSPWLWPRSSSAGSIWLKSTSLTMSCDQLGQHPSPPSHSSPSSPPLLLPPPTELKAAQVETEWRRWLTLFPPCSSAEGSASTEGELSFLQRRRSTHHNTSRVSFNQCEFYSLERHAFLKNGKLCCVCDQFSSHTHHSPPSI